MREGRSGRVKYAGGEIWGDGCRENGAFVIYIRCRNTGTMSSQDDEIQAVPPVTVDEEKADESATVDVEEKADESAQVTVDVEEKADEVLAEASAPAAELLEEEEEKGVVQAEKGIVEEQDKPEDEALSPKRALTSIVGDFEHFESFHAKYEEEAQAVFACVTSLRLALREFRKRVQQELKLQ